MDRRVRQRDTEPKYNLLLLDGEHHQTQVFVIKVFMGRGGKGTVKSDSLANGIAHIRRHFKNSASVVGQ